MLTKDVRDKLRTALREWVGSSSETLTEIVNGEALIWVVLYYNAELETCPEFGGVRAFDIGGTVAVSGDAMNCTAIEAFNALGRVVV